MKLKLLGTAVTAALLGMSTVSFADAGGSAGSGPSGQDSAKTQSAPAASSGSAVGTGSATSGSSMSSDCDKLTGSARTRCERQHNSASGSSTTSSGAPVTKQPAQSGPGTVDRDASGKPSGGTNSGGSN